MDISIEAIEADLALAEARAGQAVAQKYLVSAQVRATLLASGLTKSAGWTLPFPAPDSWNEHIEAAAFVLGMDADDLAARLDPMASSVEPPTTSVLPVEEEIVSVEPDDDEDDMDADFERLKRR